jgi:hypothetical protein
MQRLMQKINLSLLAMPISRDLSTLKWFGAWDLPYQGSALVQPFLAGEF